MIPDTTVRRICELMESGASGIDISRRTGVSVNLVEYYARRECAVRPNARSWRDVRPIDAELVALASAGATRTEISRRLGLTYSVVRTRLMTLARREAVAEARDGA